MGATPSKPTTSTTFRTPAASPPAGVTRDSSQDAAFDEKRAYLDRAHPCTSPCSKPKSANGSLTLDNISAWESTASGPVHTLARTMMPHSPITSLQRRQVLIDDIHVYNTDIQFKTSPIANQRETGRCWLFASTNVLRYSVMRRAGLSEFQLSQPYLFFYDKLNKANYYLELMMEHSDLPLNSRLISHLSSAAALLTDGGQWDMAVNLFENYGCVPHVVFTETVHSIDSAPLNSLLQKKVREHGMILRKLSQQLRAQNIAEDEQLTTLRSKKEALMAETYRMMTAMLGVPPKPDVSFDWNYYDKDNKPHTWTGTPLEFYATFIGKQPSESFSMINDQRNPYSKVYTVDKLGNIWGGRPVTYVNTDMENMKMTVVKMLQAGEPVFFGCDVLQQEDKKLGVLDVDLYDYDTPFGISLNLTKAERVAIGESSMTHAMVITGVHLDDNGRPLKYRLENAWGLDIGLKGWFCMTDAWFEEYAFQIVVPKSFAPKELVKLLDGEERIVLPAWDPMGALA
ncbi:peptidase C1B, bleomycin hydrolase [Athelia psychrophila]|uniref:Cysteine proteinase 1, mitochondrial n=1 Tax=Athelia psychrophila TaxID=1759441 RepID=A0A166FDT9_9AGAM|nr:peptidase C1B, bleomycin hydrolase [Fibularhizoctonia sp. CBS 109695]